MEWDALWGTDQINRENVFFSTHWLTNIFDLVKQTDEPTNACFSWPPTYQIFYISLREQRNGRNNIRYKFWYETRPVSGPNSSYSVHNILALFSSLMCFSSGKLRPDPSANLLNARSVVLAENSGCLMPNGKHGLSNNFAIHTSAIRDQWRKIVLSFQI